MSGSREKIKRAGVSRACVAQCFLCADVGGGRPAAMLLWRPQLLGVHRSGIKRGEGRGHSRSSHPTRVFRVERAGGLPVEEVVARLPLELLAGVLADGCCVGLVEAALTGGLEDLAAVGRRYLAAEAELAVGRPLQGARQGRAGQDVGVGGR